MDTFFLLLITIVVSLVAGCICVVPLQKKGPRAQTIGAYSSLALSMVIFAFSLFVAEACEVGTWVCLSAFLCTATAFGIKVVTRQEVEKLFTLAPRVRDVVTQEFAGFDVDDDKVVSLLDLEKILKGEAPLPAGCDRAFVSHVKEHIGLIGHEVGKYGTGANKQLVTVISPRDLATYPQRANDRYSAWTTETTTVV